MEPLGMSADEYRVRGKEMVDYIAEYLTTLRSRHVLPNVQPGYLRELVPDQAPVEGEEWHKIFHDIERVIMPGITHWQSPHMHAYFPALNSFPSLLGDMLADAINCLGFTWASSPACTELEMVVMDWLGEMLGLPSFFLHKQGGRGGGVLQGTMSEATLVAMLAARMDALTRERAKCTDTEADMDGITICSRMVAYCSEQAHSSVEKNSMISMMRLRKLPSDDNLSLRGDTLREAIQKDKEKGFIPFFVCVTLGTTGACSFDNLEEISEVCKGEDMWVHVDAAYAGTAFLCPEFRHYTKGMEYVDSFAFNPSKWLMVNFDCTAMWVKDKKTLETAFCVNPLYLKHEKQGQAIDFMHWQIPLSRRFRALKLWFVIRSFGIRGLQQHIRKGVELAKYFEGLVRQDPAFDMAAERVLGLVVFRLKGQNSVTEELLSRLNASGKLYMVPAAIKGLYVIRFTVTSLHTTKEDLKQDWELIRKVSRDVLRCPSKIRPTRLASWPTGAMDARIDAYLAEEVGLKIDQKATQNDIRLGSFMAKAGRMFPMRTNFPKRNAGNETCTCRCQQNGSPNANKKGVLRRAQSEEIKNLSKGVFFCSGCHKKLEVKRITKISSPVSIKGYERSPEAVLDDIDDDVFAVSEVDEDEDVPSSSNSQEDSDRENTAALSGNNNNVGDKDVGNGLSEKLSKMAANGSVGDQHEEGQTANPVSMGRFGALSQTKESKYNGVVNITHFHAATAEDNNQTGNGN